MKSFARLLREVAQPKSGDELNFKDKHEIEFWDHPESEESQHTAEKKSKRRRADYDRGEDMTVYEALKGAARVSRSLRGDIVQKPLNKSKVMAMKPPHAGTVAGVKFYEHPTKGDESPLIADVSGGKFGISSFWEVPDMDELTEAKLDPVGKEDDDVNNDGKVDAQDSYLKNRRKTIAKAMKEDLSEKAVSQAQQKAAGAALAAKRGEIPVSELQGAAKEMFKMKTKDLEDFARTKHKGLPDRVDEDLVENPILAKILRRLRKSPEQVKDFDESAFIAKAAYSKKAGKDKFRLGDDEYPVTIRKATADKITESKLDMVAIGRKLQQKAPKERNDQISNAMANLADHLESYGTPFGAKNMKELSKKTGLSTEIIQMLIKRVMKEGFEPGEYELNDGSIIKMTEYVAEALDRLYDTLTEENQEKMCSMIFEDKETFESIVTFAKEKFK
jgi:hypothetical protein